MGNSLQTALEVWRRMGLMQRLVLVSVVLGCVGAAVLLVGWARQPDMALLYTGLDPQEASQIVEKVRDAGVPYELKDGGTAVYVPTDRVYALRLELAGEGLPAGGSQGYRILDTEKIGTSPFTQRINYARALEGELAKTIALIDGVADARVHIVRPESKLFHDNGQAATATVVLRLRPGRRLSAQNVAAVIHLVAGSVDHLKAEDVVVVDNLGNLLSSPVEQGFAGSAGTLLDYKTQVEQYLAKKAEDMLAMVLGPGRATIKVDARIETSTVNQTAEKFDPDAKVATKEELTTKSETPAAGAGEAAPAGASKEETTTTEYMVGRTVEQTVNMPGKILSLSVAAFVDLSAPEPSPTSPETTAEGTAPAGSPTPPAPALTADDVEQVIRNALGLQETDTLKVVATTFRRPAPPPPAAEESLFASPAFYLDVARHASLGILVVGALAMLKIFGGPRRKIAPAPTANLLGAGQGTSADHLLMAGTQALPLGSAELNHRIGTALQDNPDEVKRLFRTWVENEEGAA